MPPGPLPVDAPRHVDRAVLDRYAQRQGRVFLTGVQALVRLPLDQMRRDRDNGLRTAAFVSGYEGSPLGGYDIELARQRRLLSEYDIAFQPAVNEELAATAVAGSQAAAGVRGFRYDGVLGIWYGKAPGLDRATDALRHGNFAGTQPLGGALVLVGDDPSTKSSSIPSASEHALADMAIPTLYPGDPREVLELGLHAVALSRASGAWVALKMVTSVADGWMDVDVGVQRAEPHVPVPDGVARPAMTPLVTNPARLDAERSLFEVRVDLASRYAAANQLNRVTVRHRSDRVGIVAAGKTYHDVWRALGLLGLDDDALHRAGVRLLQVAMPFPLEPSVVHGFADGLSDVIVVEEKRPFLETAVKDILYGVTGAPRVTGKVDRGERVLALHGELGPDVIATGLARLLTARGVPVARTEPERSPRTRTTLPLVKRVPYFCSGCPHNRSTVVPDGALVGAGIGCHALVTRMPDLDVGEVTGMTQMGGEGAQWIGMAPFVEDHHLFQNIGDGTFTHSGSLAVRAAVAAGVDITFKLLYNDAVAMTGGQVPTGRLTVPRLARLLLAEGVRRVIVTTEDPGRYGRRQLPGGVPVWSRDRLLEAQRTLASVPGVTVLIHDQACAAESRRKRKRGLVREPATRVFINERVCEGCGDCGRKSNCLSVEPVETEFGRKTRIHQDSCNKDLSCLDGDCPAFVTVTTGARPVGPAVPAIDGAEFPVPVPRVPEDRFAVRICGIGGTGVVTTARTLGVAAMLAGRHVRGLDMTGLAQKGGPVVSDVVVSTSDSEPTNAVTTGGCDTYLVCDLLVGADAAALGAADPARTVAVVSTTSVPTGEMVANLAVPYPEVARALGPIEERTRAGEGTQVDARDLAVQLTGSDATANTLLLGVAYQCGTLPLPVTALEGAIELNGVDVSANIQAFRRGRQAVADPDGLAAVVAPAAAAPEPDATAEAEPVAGLDAEPGSMLHLLASTRARELVAYQDERYAQRYVAYVARVAAAEQAAAPGRTALAEAVAEYLYKLMAYKDEYEVARLCLLPEADEQIAAQFGAGARYAWRLHPPVLRALGMDRKVSLGPWFRPAFSALRAMRRLRGTAFDPFGHTAVRRTERALVDEYLRAVDVVLARLDAGNHHVAVELARLPDLVRGYEDVKMAGVGVFRGRLRELLARLERTQPRTGTSRA